MPAQTEESILDALRACFDPTLRLDLVAAGMVHTIRLEQDHDAPGQRRLLELLPCSADPDRRAQLRAQVLNRLAGLEALSHVAVELRNDPPWTPARISGAGRRTLGLDASVFPILNNRRRP